MNLRKFLLTIGSGARPIVYLLRDDFTTTEAAPMTSPRTCEPGPGAWTISDVGNRLSIAAAKLSVAGGTDNYSITSGVQARAAGLALFGVCVPGSTQPVRFGFTDDAGDVRKQAWYLSTNPGAYGFYHGGLNLGLFTYSDIQKYAIILRAAGAFYLGLVGGGVENTLD